MKKLLVLIIAIIVLIANPALSQWTECNNGMYGGMTTCFVIKDGYLFAGSTGGLYRSSNNGINWVHIYNGLPQYPVRTLLIFGPNIFAGTSGGGIYVTTDNGESWSPSNTGITNQSILSFLLKGLYLFAGTTNGGIFVSTNNGSSWQPANSGLPNAGVNNFITIGDSIYIATGSGVYLSSNNGTSWVVRNSGLTSTNINSITYDGTILYAASHTNGVYLSTNKGDNWSNSSNGITNLSILDIKNNITKVFAATNGDGVFYSTDGGSNWIPASNGLYNTYVLKLFINGSAMYAGTDGGAFYTTNEGNYWSDITSGLTNSVIIYLTRDDNSNVYAGTYGRGAFKSTNNGTSWFEINTGLEELYCYSLISKINFLFGGLWNGQVCRSTNLGGNWLTVVPRTIPRTMVWSFALIGNNLFHGNSINGVYLSTNDGINWSAVNNGLTNTNVRCMVASGTNLFAGTSGGGVFLSTNNGANWQAVISGLSDLNINSITANGSDIYAGTSGSGVFLSTNNGTDWQAISAGMGNRQVRSIVVSGSILIAATDNGTYYSTNNGTNWQTANGGLLNMNDWALVINGSDVFLGTFGNGTFKAPLSSFSGIGVTSITTGTVPNSICTGSTINVPYTITGIFNPGNTFTAQLSDASGNFSFPTTIGSINSTISGTITSIIPVSIISGSGYRIRVIGSNPATTGTDNGSNISINPKPFPVINGLDIVCQNTSNTYTTMMTPGNSYLWEVNGGSITGSSNLASVLINWTTSNSSGTVTLVETVDATGCKDSAFKSVTLNPSPNPIITGLDTVCNNSTQTYSCSLVTGHSYSWNVSGGSLSSSNNNIANINWNTSNSSGTVSVQETIDATGCSTSTSKTVTILKMPSPTISGDFDVCNESIQNYSTTFTMGDTYLWRVTGGSIIGANNQINVSVNWNTTHSSDTLTLIETNGSTLCRDSAVQIISVHPLPTPSITGTNISFVDSIEVYSTTPINGNSVRWSVRGGSIIGPTDNISPGIRWLSTPSGTVTLVQTVDATGCKDSTLMIVTIKPFSPYFSGSQQVCKNTIENYSASIVNGCSYHWTVIGGNILGAAILPSIQVQWLNIGSGSIFLVMTIDSSGYKDSSFKNITINPLPSVPLITGTSSSCVNKIEDYSTPALQGFSYKWISDGGFIVSDENQPDVQVRWLTEPSGTITVIKTIIGSNCSSSSSQAVSVYPVPVPFIQGATSTLNNADEHYSVTENTGSLYKWYLQGGTFLSADNLPEIDVQWGEGTSGHLKCIETNNFDCSDSNEITVALFVSSVQDNSNKNNIILKIIPNPVNGKAKIEIAVNEDVNANLQIVNSYGRIVSDFGSVFLQEGTQSIDWDGNNINGESIPSGIYFIKLSSKYGVAIAKAVLLRQ